MPRHGPREFRGSRCRSGPGQVLHFGQGRPRGASRSRCRLHGRHPGPDRFRRLAHVRLLHPRRAPLLRRHLLPACGAPGDAVVPPRGRRRSADAWTNERAQVLEQADALVGAVQRELRLAEALSEEVGGGGPGRGPALRLAGAPVQDGPDPDVLVEQVVAGLAPGFDPEWGGFGPAPKFPRPTLVELCLRRARRGGSDAAHARHMGLRTLDAMAAGGIYDHLVGGFCRYSTDAHWLVPHFEKMLTDQAQLARAYLHAWQDGGRGDYLGVVTETLDFVLRDLSTPEGALYSSFDADAGGVEGAHATFTLEELRQILPASLVGPAADWYGITAGGNWEGRSIPVRPVGAPLARPPEVEEARVLLAAARATRVQPARDEKVLTRVERHGGRHPGRGGGGDRTRGLRPPCRGDRRVPLGLHVRGRTADAELAGWAGAPSGRGGGLRLAGRGVLPAVRMDGRARCGASGRSGRCISCSTCSGTTTSGGFFTTGSDAEALVVRPKEFLDGAVPASNSVAVAALLHAGRLRRRSEGRRGDRAHRGAGRAAAGAASRRAGRPGGGAAHVERAQRDRGHGRTPRPARRGAPQLAPRRRGRVGRARRRPALRGAARPSPAWPTSARGARARCPRRTPLPWPANWSH